MTEIPATNETTPTTEVQSANVNTCKQILPGGRYCQCPALKDGTFCYYHHRDRQRLRNLKVARRVKGLSEPKRATYRELDALNTEILESLELPSLDDAAGIQVTLTNLIRAVYSDHISYRKARIILESVREAAINLRHNQLFKPPTMPIDLVDPEPIDSLGNEGGYVLPEETEVQKADKEVWAAIVANRKKEEAAEAAYRAQQGAQVDKSERGNL